MTTRNPRFERDFLSNPKFKPLVERAKLDIQEYWAANIGKYFTSAQRMRMNIQSTSKKLMEESVHPDQIAKACYITVIGNELAVVFKSVRSADGRDYGDFLVYGTSASRGKFVPAIGARMREKDSHELIGQTRGISTIPWNRWMADFSAYVERRLDQLEDEIYNASSIDDIVGESYDR